ncbi:MAG: hypothetical protein KKB31_04840 [Nanoarchaeota archaeon]|nr:hypothetical protein [Nanoarchaeota archaeon]
MKKSVVIVTFILLLAPLLSAATTEIKIKTVPFGNINVNILELGSLEVIEHINLDANNYGDATFSFSSSQSYFDMTVYIKQGDSKFHYEKFTGNTAGGTLSFEAAPEGFEFFYPADQDSEINGTTVNDTEVNDTIVNETIEEVEVIEEVEEQGPGITGLATSDDVGFFAGKTLYYVIGIGVLLAIVFFGSMSMRKKISAPKEIKVRKLSELRDEKSEKTDDYRQAIEQAERKIEEAQKEIKKIKNEDKIAEAKKRIAKEQEELEKLEKGED